MWQGIAARLAKLALPVMLIATLPLFKGCVNMESTSVQTYTETEFRDETISEKYTENETRIISIATNPFELTPLFNWSNPDISFSKSPYTWYYAYEIAPAPEYDNIHLKLTIPGQFQYEKAIIRMFDMSRGGHIPAPDPPPEEGEEKKDDGSSHWIEGKGSVLWLKLANTRINQAFFLAGSSNRWSKAEEHILEVDAGRATRIAVIISGPSFPWNVRTSLSGVWKRNVTESYPVTRERQVTRQVPYVVEKQKTVRVMRQAPFWEALLQK